MSDDRSAIDWSLTTWEGSRRGQIRRWSQLTMDEILAAQEEMAALAEELRATGSANVRQEPTAVRPVTRNKFPAKKPSA